MLKTKILTSYIILLIITPYCQALYAQRMDTIIIRQLIGQENFPSVTPTSIFRKDDPEVGRYVGMPQNIDTSQLSFIPLDVGQYYFDRFKNGKLTYEEFSNRFSYKVDTNTFSKTIIKHKVGVFSGLSGKNKIVIIDANNNYNFSDDKHYVFDTTHYFKKKWKEVIDTAPIVKVHIELFNLKEISQRERDLKITVFNDSYSYKDEMAKNLAVYYTHHNSFVGTYNINGQSFNFEIEARKPYNILVTPKGKSKIDFSIRENFIYKINEKFVLNGNIVSIAHISHLMDTLFLTNYGKGQNVEGNKLGMLHPPFCNKFIQADSFCLNDFRGKYILIDFWGTWCKPCIASIPDLKHIRDKFSADKLVILSVAADNDINKVNQEIEHLKMNWLHTQQTLNSKNVNDATNIFRVNTFPTTILVDKQGLIIDRGSGTEYVKGLYEKLEKLIR